jgi:hypothetical protein
MQTFKKEPTRVPKIKLIPYNIQDIDMRRPPNLLSFKKPSC